MTKSTAILFESECVRWSIDQENHVLIERIEEGKLLKDQIPIIHSPSEIHEISKNMLRNGYL